MIPVDSCTFIIFWVWNQPLESKCITWVPRSLSLFSCWWILRNWGINLLIQTHIIQRHSQLPQGWSPSDRRWWWQKALSELTLEVFFGLCVTGQVRFGATESGTGELVLWGFKDFPRIFQGFPRIFPRIFQGFPRWRVESQWSYSLQELICIDMYHPQLPMRALVKRRQIWLMIDGWNSFPFICIPLLLYQSSIFVAMRQTSLSWIATTRWEQCQPMPTIYYCYFAVVDVRWFSGASHENKSLLS